MNVLILNPERIRELLTMRECIEVMRRALRDLALDRMVLPLRQVVMLPDRTGLMAIMPSVSQQDHVMAAKVISVFPQNRAIGLESHQGVVLLFDAKRGELLAIIEAGSLTAIRTAAASGLATDLLARADAKDLAILGSGVEAWTHLEAMLAVRKIARVRVWSRTLRNAEDFATRVREELEVAVDVVSTAREAVSGADVICTVTAAVTPVLEGAWISPGAHINAVGACTPNARELDSRAVSMARLFVDRRESTLKESGDFLIARQEGAIGDNHILGELGDLLLERVPGRRSPDEITLFESLGIAIEDLAAAHFLYNKVKQHRAGFWIDFGE